MNQHTLCLNVALLTLHAQANLKMIILPNLKPAGYPGLEMSFHEWNTFDKPAGELVPVAVDSCRNKSGSGQLLAPFSSFY
ncbi:hypothetical protein TNIN_67621 [Trichonephila inaurata madagascariensis]|uniref:Uncharacterized protein n=1 Tax=Trichonephila inaurata madagascariensis TaxID=2747483 RepID=A0A8X6JMX8_9ARAC|nr:hypothetical protein TNIN_67621 [Trichonephila inaurata madagascariensis]